MSIFYKRRYNNFFKVENGVKTRISEEEWLSAMGLLGEDHANGERNLREEERTSSQEDVNEDENGENAHDEKEEAQEQQKSSTYWKVLREQTVKKLESGNYDYEDLSQDEWNSLGLPTAD